MANTIKGKLSCGFEYAIEPERLDNMELIDAIAEADRNPIAVSTVVDLLLGDQKKELYNCLRTEKGNVPVKAVSEAVAAIFKNSNAKNS